MGIILTERGRKLCEEMVLKAYYDPEKREEIEKIAKVLGIDLEKLKDSSLKRHLDIEEPAAKETIFATMSFSGNTSLAEGSHVFDDLLKELQIKGVKPGRKIKITIETENDE